MSQSNPTILFAPKSFSKINIQRNKPSIFNSNNNEASSYASFKASFTIEAAFIMPMFITLIVLGIYVFYVLTVQAGVQKAMDGATRVVAASTAITSDNKDELTAIALAEKNLVVDKVPVNYIKGGILGISFVGSETSQNYVELRATYNMAFPIGILEKRNFKVVQVSRSRKWVGYDPSEHRLDGEYVYVTVNGEVYHRDLNCTYLNPSVRAVSKSEVKNIRNESGGKYERCSVCRRNKDNGVVYVTDYGQVYHTSMFCSSIKRTINRVLYEDVRYTHRACSKCG